MAAGVRRSGARKSIKVRRAARIWHRALDALWGRCPPQQNAGPGRGVRVYAAIASFPPTGAYPSGAAPTLRLRLGLSSAAPCGAESAHPPPLRCPSRAAGGWDFAP